MNRDQLLAVAAEPNIAAFLRVVRACEGTATDDGYRTMFGYEKFTSFADHPRKLIVKGGYRTTAAGAYQFIIDTWDEVRVKYNLPDFSPESQDAGAVGLLIRRDAIEPLRAGNLDLAVDRCNEEWASLPGSPYGQPMRDMAFVRKVYAMFGGRLTGEAAPIENRTQPTTIGVRPNDAFSGFDTPGQRATPLPTPQPVTSVSPFVIPALSALADLIPSIGKLFKGESPSAVAERNLASVELIAEKLIPLVVAATGAPNAQGAVEIVQTKPAVREAVDKAVQASYFELLDASEKSTSAARDFNLQYAQLKDVRTVVGRFTFIEFLTLVLLAISGGLTGWMLHANLLKGELLGAVVTLVVVAGFVEVRKFWLGLPSPEQPKQGER